MWNLYTTGSPTKHLTLANFATENCTEDEQQQQQQQKERLNALILLLFLFLFTLLSTHQNMYTPKEVEKKRRKKKVVYTSRVCWVENTIKKRIFPFNISFSSQLHIACMCIEKYCMLSCHTIRGGKKRNHIIQTRSFGKLEMEGWCEKEGEKRRKII
jgi:hypothetical protein